MQPFDKESDGIEPDSELTDRYMSHRRLFNDVASLYDQARPEYPEILVDDLVNLTGLTPDSRVLEIGCGTGQLTVALAERGLSILAVELGANLAEYARQKLVEFPGVTVVVADFDNWHLPATPFDLVIAATSFHWLNPATRVDKAAGALRPGTTLALVETHWSAGSGRDRFFVESQVCYERWDPHHDPGFEPCTPDILPTRNEELERSEQFEGIHFKQYISEQHYDAASYIELLGTFSDILSMEENARSGFLQCIAHLIDSRFDGCIARKHLYRMWLAGTRK
jgi:SAM-dependent methyltransferase